MRTILLTFALLISASVAHAEETQGTIHVTKKCNGFPCCEATSPSCTGGNHAPCCPSGALTESPLRPPQQKK